MFGWEFPPHYSGGLGVACFGLSRALSQKHVDITFVLPKKMDVNSDYVRVVFAGVDVEGFAVNSTLAPYITSEMYSSWSQKLKEEGLYGATLIQEVMRYAELAKRIAQREKFDIIHAHDWLSFPAAMEAKKVSGKPFVAHVHATEFDRCGGDKGVNQNVYEIEKAGLEAADKVVAVSGLTKHLLHNQYGIPEEKIEVVHNGIDLDRYALPPTTHDILKAYKDKGYKIVMFLGRITLQKGPDYFVKMAKRILDINQKVLFVVVGDGDMFRRMVEEAAWLGISDKFYFTGWQETNIAGSIYASADLFVMPSVSEPFGLVPLEALVHGTPVLISRQSGVSEVVFHALKTDFWDIDDMADKAIAALSYNSLHDCLKQNGEKEAKGCTWHKAADKCINIYSQLI